ncbi:hypothetical protein B0T26DRAFT_726506 [Lasiosphaeria miniovina]|uniref:Uncharacterized protein n=1 Tax=Lasiosphaeria miniovina TaxID=1954250 RepID=A0AA39ZZA6_9PEZI|nr:uncharacterized protein B0T26DRAFT_726506 [Lasiosphaeria miniovina]KAK0706423.1 hypothetical protein B0T26DRAFT_726506 [Lasiosphaeria miniovina]
MARLGNARSASLRKKLESITQNGTSITQEEVGDGDDAKNEIRRRIWLRCQTDIRAEPIKRIDSRKKSQQLTVREPPGQPGLHDLIDFGALTTTRILENDAIMNTAYREHMAENLPLFDHPRGGYETVQADFDTIDTHYNSGDDKTSSDDWMDDPDADYFYADGNGNIYLVERQAVFGLMN